jgi:hypothetical protein
MKVPVARLTATTMPATARCLAISVSTLAFRLLATRQIWKLCADFYYVLGNAKLARFSSLGNVFIGSLAFAIDLAGLFIAGASPL